MNLKRAILVSLFISRILELADRINVQFETNVNTNINIVAWTYNVRTYEYVSCKCVC